MKTTKATDVAAPGALWLSMVTLVRDNPFPKAEAERLIGMPFSRFRALRRVEFEARTQRELADRMRVDASAMTGIVADLETRGLITRRPSPHDRRSNIVEITDAGRALLDRVRAAGELAPAFMAALDDAQRASLATILATLRKSQS